MVNYSIYFEKSIFLDKRLITIKKIIKMFDSKKTSLFSSSKPASEPSLTSTMVSTNPFIKAGLKASSETTESGNGALKYTTSGSDFVDQFAKVTNYKKPRSYAEISSDMSLLFGQSKLLTLALTFYIRMITRVVQFFNGDKTSTTQRGQGLKHEGIFRMIWIAINASETFWKNITLFISVGSWKDIITMLSYDLQYNGWKDRKLDWNKFGALILAGLENPNTSNLVKKYLPQIKTNSQCKTIEAQADNMIAKWICSLLFGTKGEETGSTYRNYRKLKTSGTAHEWQQLISQHKLLEINFDTVHGRALAQLVSGKFLSNNHLEEKYEAWIASKPIAKYTGYVYELLGPVKSGYHNNQLKKYQEETINKQFYGLIETAKSGMNTNSSFIVIIDTSSSMTSQVPGTKVSAYDVAKSMALYFSYLLKGPFQKAYMEFADKCEMRYWKGTTPVEHLQNDNHEAYGSTNFQSVIHTFGKIKSTGVPESEFPTGILCVSDGCFNSTSVNKTNFKMCLNYLKVYGFSEDYIKNFKIVLWDIPNCYYGNTPQTSFEDFADAPNLFHMSGLDGSAIAFLMGTEYNPTIPKNSDELFLTAMNQEVLNLLEV